MRPNSLFPETPQGSSEVPTHIKRGRGRPKGSMGPVRPRKRRMSFGLYEEEQLLALSLIRRIHAPSIEDVWRRSLYWIDRIVSAQETGKQVLIVDPEDGTATEIVVI